MHYRRYIGLRRGRTRHTLDCKGEGERAGADDEKGRGSEGEVGQEIWGKMIVDVLAKRFSPNWGKAGVGREGLRARVHNVGDDPRGVRSQHQSLGYEQPQAARRGRTATADDENENGYWRESAGSDVD